MLGQKSLAHRRLAGACRWGLAQFWRDRSGVTAVEFAIITPVMVFIFICIADLGIGMYTDMQVNNAAQYGTEYALIKGYNSSAISSAVQSSTSLSNASVSPTQFCGCPSANGIVSSSCNSSCSDGTKAGTFVKVAVSDSYATILRYPGLPSKFNLTAQSTVRLQ
jgi:Flp pilus assembly protein TadG